MIRTRSRIITILLSFILLFGMMELFGIDNTYSASKKIHLKKTTITLVAGKTYQQKLIDKKGKTIKAAKVKWKSSETSVAKIDKKGKIKTINPGTAKMTAKYNGKTYKFTVKVKNVFSPDERPEITKVIQYKTKMFIYWTELEKADCYQLFVSTNGETYELEDEDFCNIGCVWYPKEGNTYSFKVRAKSGNCYSDFSEADSAVFSPRNTKITSNPSSISMRIGERKLVRINVDRSCDISCDFNDGIAKCQVNTNDENSYKDIYITGVNVGNTTVEVFDAVDHSVKTSIDVAVLPPPIQVDESSVTLFPEEVKTLTLYLDKNRNLNYQTTGQGVERCSFGEWDEETKSMKLFIHSGYPGEGKVRVYDRNDSSVDATIDVTVDHGVTVILPTMPETHTYFNADGSVYTAANIKNISISYRYNGSLFKTSVKLSASGTMTDSGDPSKNRSFMVNYEIYDSNGKMVGGKYLTGGSGVPGESIELNDMYGVGGLTPGIYTLKLVDAVSIN